MTRFAIPRYSLFLITALVLFTLGWSNYLMIFGHPYSGLTWSYTSGSIIKVDPDGPAAGLFEVGDHITAIDGIPVYEARNLPDRLVGDRVAFAVERQGEISSVVIRLVKPPLLELSKRLSIIPIAFTFWLLGAIVLAYGQSDRLVHLFFLFCQITAVNLGLGAISSYAPISISVFFSALLWWMGPLTFHTHLALSSWERLRVSRRVVTVLYTLALLFSLIDTNRLRLSITGPLLSIKYIWIGVLMLAAACVLVITSLRDSSPEHRRRTKIAGIAAVAAFLPSILFSLVPEAITGQFILPYEITFLALLILPLGYSYSILLYRLVKVEREISQSAAFALAIFVIAILYAFLFIFFSNSFDLHGKHISIIEILTVIVMALTAHPVHQALYRWLYRIFYGGWFDDREAVRRIFQDLKHVTGDTYSIAQTLCLTLQRTMLLEYVNLLLSDGSLLKTNKDQTISSEVFSPDTRQIADLFRQLQEKTGRELGSGEVLKDFLSGASLESGSLLGPRPHLWLLFGGRSDWQGLLVLGSKRGQGNFGAKDVEILEVVLRQAGAALENELLIDAVSQRSNQIRELNRKNQWALEVERKRIARNLHDIVIQTLVGINFQLANVRARQDPETARDLEAIRKDLHESLVELRGICADLRPPALDALGLLPAIEARITEIKSQVSFEVYQKIADLGEIDVRDEVALCVYRFLQEGLVNIQKHSEASIAMINLNVDPENWLHLSIEDDGQGFTPPQTLEVLVTQQHFGLVGLQEQVEAVGGKMIIESSRGKGCRLDAWVPLLPGGQAAPAQTINIEKEGLFGNGKNKAPKEEEV